MTNKSYKTVIIGAGLSGISAANSLLKKDIKIMESLAEQRKATQAVLDKTLLKMQEIEKQVADMTG